MANKIAKLFKKIAKSAVFEDRREYDAQDLALAYGLTVEESNELFALIQNAFKA
jgi:hypothetical protein